MFLHIYILLIITATTKPQEHIPMLHKNVNFLTLQNGLLSIKIKIQ